MGICYSTSQQQTTSIGNQYPACHASSLRPSPTPYIYGKPITRDQLEKLRMEFWSTRVGGDVNMWQALRSACDALLNNDIQLARVVLEASEITITNGSLG